MSIRPSLDERPRIIFAMKRALLGGLTPQQFLARHWQREPLLVRGAIPEFSGCLTPAELFALARRDDVESRLVQRCDGAWRVAHGPFRAGTLQRKPRHPWTLLVQGVNTHCAAADRLMRSIDFIPWARLDDLMVSYAADGGGVGPHFDSYDVFLLQGMGRRRWQVSAQTKLDLVAHAPLRILRRFRPEQEWLLEPGDMLYLPPRYAHDGVAQGACMTYSIGFRAPAAQEVATEFLAYLQERICCDGMYADPSLRAPRHRGEIGSDMVRGIEAMVDRIDWSRRHIEDFLGCYLTAPKPQVFFSRPAEPLPARGFRGLTRRRGVALDPKTQLLFRRARFFVNGEPVPVSPADRKALRRLADDRKITTTDGLSEDAMSMLYAWYGCGWCHPLGAAATQYE